MLRTEIQRSNEMLAKTLDGLRNTKRGKLTYDDVIDIKTMIENHEKQINCIHVVPSERKSPIKVSPKISKSPAKVSPKISKSPAKVEQPTMVEKKQDKKGTHTDVDFERIKLYNERLYQQQLIEEQYNKQSKEILERKWAEIAEFGQKNKQNLKDQYDLISKKTELNLQILRKNMVIPTYISPEEDESKISKDFKSDYVSKKIKEKLRENQLQEEENYRKQMIESETKKLKVKEIRKNIHQITLKSKEIISNFCGSKPVGQDLVEIIENLRSLGAQIDTLSEELILFTDDHITSSSLLLIKAQQIFQNLLNNIENATQMNKLFAEQHAREEEKRKELEETALKEKITTEKMALDILGENIEYYNITMEAFKKFDADVKMYSEDKSIKMYRFELQRLCFTIINGITKGQRIKEKLKLIQELLSGDQIQTSKGHISIRQHASGSCFAIYYLAKSIVQQAEEQVSSQPQTAFPIAELTVQLWALFPVLGKILMAMFYIRCPYLVPYLPTDENAENEEKYTIKSGLHYDGNKLQDDNEDFLKRMSGLAMLFAAIIQTPHPKHPFSLDRGWRWLSSILNMKPQPSITPTMITCFLEVAGPALQESYRQQFFRLLSVLDQDYLPIIRQLPSSGASAATLERLRILLSKVKEHKQFPRMHN